MLDMLAIARNLVARGLSVIPLDHPDDTWVKDLDSVGKARQRTRDAMLRKAKAGHVTGGRVFGYDNVRLETHVERRINETEAAVIRRIFQLAALGHGHRSIAHALNNDGVPAPRPQLGRPVGWAPASVREVLLRPLYRGVIEWDRVRRNGQGKQRKSLANAAPLRIAAPHLRIVAEDVAAKADVIRVDRSERYLRRTNGQLISGSVATHAVKHVLSGLLRCRCGASFEAQSAAYGRRRGGVYVCSAARRKGRAVCTNDLHLPIAETEAAILETVERDLLQADIYAAAVDRATARLQKQTTAPAELTIERDRIAGELANLANAIAAGGDMPAIVAEMRSREARKRELDRVINRDAIDLSTLRATLEAKLADLKRLLRSRPTHGQRVLKSILDGPIAIGEPTAAGVPWSACGSLSAMFGTLSWCVASPTGFEPVF